MWYCRCVTQMSASLSPPFLNMLIFSLDSRIRTSHADGVAYPQWTGPSSTVIGVPGAIQALYAELQDGHYNSSSQEYTFRFNDLPEDSTYCSQPTTVANVRVLMAYMDSALVLSLLMDN